ncbi:SDR family NAD(P)-dependent oxidoreductase [Miniphocaeibacter massiliensis]|uniref:SDR family NAD(P)-dependent oxidoreductase n=1 Tax=Miniphocaeibacter massiliensis TaxID=2041841 RepID=UPI000C1C080A|nr:SDR family oxidoreductase [Miniphocaeibacter massiliensis]
MNYFDFKNKVAVVFGATSRIGRAAALGYGDCGAKVAILSENKEDLKELFKEMGNKGYTVAMFECDVTSEDSIKNAAEEIVERFGSLDILFNNSGIIQHGSIEDLTEEEWNQSMNINVRSAYMTMKYLIPEMKKNGYGKIVNTSSANAVVFNKNENLVRHAYNVSKAAMVGLTKAVGATYMKDGITVNSVGLGIFEGELGDEKELVENYLLNNPSGRLGKMEELIGTIMYLSSDASNYITGQFLLADGGMTLV